MQLNKVAICCLTLIVAQGCAHIPLKRNVVKQSQTLGNLYEQQVLDGIATYVVNPGATPSFALPIGGGATVNQAGTALGGLNWNSKTFVGASTGINGTQSLSENWTLKPINDPLRLSLMKCVYQHATGRRDQGDCEDCVNKLRIFFGDDFDCCKLPSCFFEKSSKHPGRNNCCVKYGEACGCYVIVDSEHFDCLSKLTMSILEIATISDEGLAKRMSRTDPKKIEISTSFIANVGGKPQLIQGKYSIPFEKFEELQRAAIPDLTNADAKLSPLGVGVAGDTIEFNTLNASPVQSDSALRQRTEDANSSIQSLLQMNQFPIPR